MAWRQVTPLQWPSQRMRHVLSHAFGGFISDEMLDAAAQALDLGFEGSLSRYATGSQKPCMIRIPLIRTSVLARPRRRSNWAFKGSMSQGATGFF